MSYMNAYIRNLVKGPGELICRAGIEAQAWRTGLWTPWGKGRAGCIGSSTDIYTLPAVRQIASVPRLYRPGVLSALRDLGGWDEGVGGSRVRERLYTHVDSTNTAS